MWQRLQQQVVGAAARERICRVRNCVEALAQMHIAIHRDTIMDVYADSITLGLPAKGILNPDMLQTVTQTALARKAA